MIEETIIIIVIVIIMITIIIMIIIIIITLTLSPRNGLGYYVVLWYKLSQRR